MDLPKKGRPDAAMLDVGLGDGETDYPIADWLEALGVPCLFAAGEVRIGDGRSTTERTGL